MSTEWAIPTIEKERNRKACDKISKSADNEQRQDKRLYFTNKLVQFAIEKQFVFADAIKKSPWTKFKKMAGQTAVTTWMEFSKGVHLDITMSSTERFIRSLSFVIGVERAYKAGLLNTDTDWWNYTETKDINQVIEVGRIYSEKMNFGLSTQATGEFNYNGFGNLMGKFKYWSQQKFGSDVRIFHEAYMSMKTMKGVESDKFEFTATLKVLGRMFRRNKTLRVTNPEVMALKNFLLTQGALTILVDIATLGVFPAFTSLIGMKKILYYGSGSKALRGFTSDLVSLAMMPWMVLGLFLNGSYSDDEEEIERTVRFYVRKSFFGAVPMWAFDNIVWMVSSFGKAIEDTIQSAWDTNQILRGGTLPHNEYIMDPIADKVIKDEWRWPWD